jgi:hypothetical protein
MLNKRINLPENGSGKFSGDIPFGLGHLTWTKIALCKARMAIFATERRAGTAIAPFEGSFSVHDLIF